MTKEEIIDQVRRLAKANDGAPIGMATFHRKTGITYSDWFGKYWARWGDLIQEAGLRPGEMQKAFEEEMLFQNLTELIRELGHFPVKGEFRLKKIRQKDFPNEKTFSRFGSKSDLILKVIKYCRDRNQHLDVLKICENSIKDLPDKEVPSCADSNIQIGHVYLIKSGRFYKIGKTRSIGRREYDLALQLAEKPNVIHVIRTDDPEGIERYWHKRFEKKRKNGEWFDLHASDVRSFRLWIRIV